MKFKLIVAWSLIAVVLATSAAVAAAQAGPTAAPLATPPVSGSFAQVVVPSPSRSPSPSPSPAAAQTSPTATDQAASRPAPRAGGAPFELALPLTIGGILAFGGGAYLLRRGGRRDR